MNPESYKSTVIQQITDTVDADARSKVASAYRRACGDYGYRDVEIIIVGRRNTQAIGVFAASQISPLFRAHRTLIGVNCAAPDKEEGTKDNARRDFYYADIKPECRMEDEIYIGGTCNGMEFSYIKPLIRGIYRGTRTNALKSQFRSAEVLPPTLTGFSRIDIRDQIIERLGLVDVTNLGGLVPDVPDVSHVIEVDNFKNIKIYTSRADEELLRNCRMVNVRIGKQSIENGLENASFRQEFNALVTPTLFDAELGTNLLTLSSSSILPGKKQVPMFATIRKRPAETSPNYEVPRLGERVYLDPA